MATTSPPRSFRPAVTTTSVRDTSNSGSPRKEGYFIWSADILSECRPEAGARDSRHGFVGVDAPQIGAAHPAGQVGRLDPAPRAAALREPGDDPRLGPRHHG